jgi:hypothetical protein
MQRLRCHLHSVGTIMSEVLDKENEKDTEKGDISIK